MDNIKFQNEAQLDSALALTYFYEQYIQHRELTKSTRPVAVEPNFREFMEWLSDSARSARVQ